MSEVDDESCISGSSKDTRIILERALQDSLIGVFLSWFFVSKNRNMALQKGDIFFMTCWISKMIFFFADSAQ